MKFRPLPLFLLLGVAGLGPTGCGGGTDPATTVYEDSPFTVRVVGRVVDREGRQPLDATVEVCGLGEAATASDGSFALEIPGLRASRLFYRADSAGHATVEGWADVVGPDPTATGNAEGVVLVDLGVLEMGLGVVLSVHVTWYAQEVPSATVFARLEDEEESETDTSCRFEAVGVTDSHGSVVLLGLDPEAIYEVVVPAIDIDGDGIPDTSTVRRAHRIASLGPTLGIDVPPSTPEEWDASVVGTDLLSFEAEGAAFRFPTGPVTDVLSTPPYASPDVGARGVDDEEVSFDAAIATYDGSVSVAFATPVDVVQGTLGPALYYRANLQSPLDAGFDSLSAVDATPYGDGSGVAWLFSYSPATLPPNEVLTLRFYVQPRSSPGTLVEHRITGYRVPYATSIVTPQADNYNRSTDATGAVGPVQLEFDDVVRGSYAVLQVVDGDVVTTYPESAPRTIGTDDDDSMVLNVATATAGGYYGGAGATPGIRYRTLLRDPDGNPIVLNDDVPGIPRTVTVALSVVDGLGNQFTHVVTLPVR